MAYVGYLETGDKVMIRTKSGNLYYGKILPSGSLVLNIFGSKWILDDKEHAHWKEHMSRVPPGTEHKKTVIMLSAIEAIAEYEEPETED